MSTLIVPCAGKSTRFPNMRPKWLLTHPDGRLMVEHAIAGIERKSFDRIVITTVAELCGKYEADLILRQVFGKSVEICILPEFTSSPSETVYKTIKHQDISGSLVVRDSDNYVSFPHELVGDNFVAGVDLNHHRGGISNIPGKSFLVVNNENIIIDIVEKRIRSNVISLGVYGFRASEDFCESFERLVENGGSGYNGEIFLSHIIAHLIGRGDSVFHYAEANGYEDYGTLEDWRKVLNRHATYFFDVDGIVFENSGKYGSTNWSNNKQVINENLMIIKKLADQGSQIFFTTSRTEEYIQPLVDALKHYKIGYKNIITGCHHAPRIIVNDFANSNPFPSCQAVSIPRNSNISQYLAGLLVES